MTSLRVSCTKCGGPLEPGRLMCVYCGVLQEFIPEPAPYVGGSAVETPQPKHSYRGRTFEYWLAGLESTDQRVVVRAVVALRAIGGPVYSLPFLVGTRIFGIIPAAARWHGRDASVVPTLVDWLSGGRTEVFDALGQLEGADVTHALTGLLRRPIDVAHPTLHLRAIAALRRRSLPAGSLTGHFSEALHAATSVTCRPIQRELSMALRALDDLNALPALISTVERDGSPASVWALNSLAILDDPAASRTAEAVLAGGRHADERRAACVALGKFGDKSSTPALVRALDDADPLTARSAAWALGELGDREAVPHLAAAHRRDGVLFGQAAVALHKVDPAGFPSGSQVVERLRNKARRWEGWLKAPIKALAELGCLGIVPAVLLLVFLPLVMLPILVLALVLLAPARRLRAIERAGGLEIGGFEHFLIDPPDSHVPVPPALERPLAIGGQAKRLLVPEILLPIAAACVLIAFIGIGLSLSRVGGSMAVSPSQPASRPTEPKVPPPQAAPRPKELMAAIPEPAAVPIVDAAGDWAGQFSQPGSGTYTVRMTLRHPQAGASTVDYPSLECDGVLDVAVENDTVVLVEHITRGRERCVDGGTLTAQIRQDRLFGTAHHPGQPEGSTFVLNRMSYFAGGGHLPLHIARVP